MAPFSIILVGEFCVTIYIFGEKVFGSLEDFLSFVLFHIPATLFNIFV